MNAQQAYIFAKKYTDETAVQFGALKGAPCKIQSIRKVDDQNIVTFEWKNDAGETQTTVMAVNDGTPIYVWESKYPYKYGDIVIYASAFYRCISANQDVVFDDKKWNEIGSADGNYDIVESVSYLPPRFTAADRKLYYVIDEWCFFLWNGERWIKQQKAASYSELGFVMIDEETLSIDENGVLSIRTITNSDVNNLF